jgi:hypothetical protein
MIATLLTSQIWLEKKLEEKRTPVGTWDSGPVFGDF